MENDSKRPYRIRKLSELSLIDDFLFGLFIQDADKEIIKRILEIILDMKITDIMFIDRQHNIKNDPKKHSISLDALIVDDKGVIYNVEVQAMRIKSVAKRIRFHQSMIDREQMPSGSFEYEKLPKTIIIMIADFDVFGRGFFKYTFQNVCMEDKTLLFGDDTIKIVLNTKGHVSNGESDELVELLRFFNSSTHETAVNSKSEFIRKLDETLLPIKDNPEYGGEYMSYEEALYEREVIGIEKGEIIGKIKGAVETYLDCGKSAEETAAAIIKKFSLSADEAKEYMRIYYPAGN